MLLRLHSLSLSREETKVSVQGVTIKGNMRQTDVQLGRLYDNYEKNYKTSFLHTYEFLQLIVFMVKSF